MYSPPPPRITLDEKLMPPTVTSDLRRPFLRSLTLLCQVKEPRPSCGWENLNPKFKGLQPEELGGHDTTSSFHNDDPDVAAPGEASVSQKKDYRVILYP